MYLNELSPIYIYRQKYLYVHTLNDIRREEFEETKKGNERPEGEKRDLALGLVETKLEA